MASGASIVIDQAEVFETTDAAIADCTYVIATTARMREISIPVLEPDAAAAELKKRVGAGERCAVLFGGERNGLMSEDVARCDAILSVPVNPAFASLNLSQAAVIVAYEWSRAGDYAALESPLDEERPARREELAHFYERLEHALDGAGYFFPPEKRPGMVKNLRAAITRAGFTESEIRTLHGAIKALANQRRD